MHLSPSVSVRWDRLRRKNHRNSSSSSAFPNLHLRRLSMAPRTGRYAKCVCWLCLSLSSRNWTPYTRTCHAVFRCHRCSHPLCAACRFGGGVLSHFSAALALKREVRLLFLKCCTMKVLRYISRKLLKVFFSWSMLLCSVTEHCKPLTYRNSLASLSGINPSVFVHGSRSSANHLAASRCIRTWLRGTVQGGNNNWAERWTLAHWLARCYMLCQTTPSWRRSQTMLLAGKSIRQQFNLMFWWVWYLKEHLPLFKNQITDFFEERGLCFTSKLSDIVTSCSSDKFYVDDSVSI